MKIIQTKLLKLRKIFYGKSLLLKSLLFLLPILIIPLMVAADRWLDWNIFTNTIRLSLCLMFAFLLIIFTYGFYLKVMPNSRLGALFKEDRKSTLPFTIRVNVSIFISLITIGTFIAVFPPHHKLYTTAMGIMFYILFLVGLFLNPTQYEVDNL